jgi:tetratricopeptide (TPR) repeat protein
MKAYYQAARQGKPAESLGLFAKVYESGLPDIAPAALYEAAMIASKLPEQEQLAIELLNRYIRESSKADSSLAKNRRDAQLTLAGIYKKNKQWLAAAPLLESAARDITNSDLKQTAKLEIADLYYKAKDYKKAMNAYSALLESNSASSDNRSSTLDYESIATARSRLIDLYLDTQQRPKALLAMEEYVELDLKANKATKATRTQAETFALQLAEEQANRYQSIGLSGNLQQAFKRKQQALENAIQSYKRLESFQTEKATSAAHAGIGNLFAHLSQALLKAPVPAGLSELEREEYMIIVEEQAFPFEEKAVHSHEKNIEKLHQGQWHEGIESSLEALRTLLPARFDKRERFEGAVTHAE